MKYGIGSFTYVALALCVYFTVPLATHAQTPDLVPRTPTTGASSVAYGSAISFTGIVDNDNAGGGDAGAFQNGTFFIDRDGDGTSDYTTSASAIAGILAGENANTTGSWTVPFWIPLGNNYRVGYFVDTRFEVDEGALGELNNWSGWSTPFTVTSPYECSNGADDSDPEDTLSDYPGDPGCIWNTDNNEFDPPNTPSSPTAVPGACGTGQVAISWNSDPRATSYQLLDGGRNLLYSGSDTSFTHSGLVAGSSHSYTVVAINSGGDTPQSAPTVVSAPQVCPPSAPMAPYANPQNVPACGSGRINLAWNGVSGATSYELERDGEASPVNVGNTITYSHTGLADGSVHTYRLRALNAGGSSDWSGQAVLTAASACPAGCTGGVQGGSCNVSASAHLGTSGSCAVGYAGSCQYTCNNGTWVQNSSTCEPPAINSFKVCTTVTEECANAGGTLIVATGTPLTISWNANADTCDSVSGPGFSLRSGPPAGSQDFDATAVASSSDLYQIACQYNTGTPVARSLTVSTFPSYPELTASVSTVKIGGTTRLLWDANDDETTCSLTGGGIDGNAILNNGTGDGETGYEDVVIEGRTTFILTCGGRAAVKTVEVIPLGWEG